ncbi:MAG: DUF2071 domain-containing protein [Rhodothermales bacterium]|nr:DUF2071 domain-containing protein [Rhodothermales bacterium]MBO6779406.1 DUF2071 domain-containing protein [Rhodothermales bacterium]
MHPSLEHTAHRPWPLPDGRWTWRQSWCDLLFAHWRVPAALLRPLVPAGLNVQEFDGSSWVGVVPFRMAGVVRRPFPDLPWISAFPELNVRLYVEAEGKPGVWFLSLDATNPLAVWAARRWFHLPYHRASINFRSDESGIHYVAQRDGSGAGFSATYGPCGEPYRATPGGLDHWLTERYCLYATHPDGALLRNEVHHRPWPLQPARAWITANSMLAEWGMPLRGEPILHYARRVDVVVWDAERVYGAQRAAG